MSREQRGSRNDAERHPLFLPAILVGGVVFGFGLGLSQMYRPEVVLRFLQLTDLGLLLVMGGASVVAGVAFAVMSKTGGSAPLTGTQFGKRVKSMDRNVLLGGGIFGVGWGLSGICPGAAYASLGVGNVTILYAVAGMFVGAYVQGYVRSNVGATEGATEEPA
ncbi:YeeE/YedE family protein [Halomicroarcula sp. F13]|uniref:YeeE/YedE family protein n=1 Tax=Haloarcula rubra TaxID=2487747 RepID=A0AAW4PQP7_9EURY|nr:DUF6691 family protein [Halomicroarcula rubra]MBX0323041.1 YeeE/YedE family protein [Halomicroarcula rubra]